MSPKYVNNSVSCVDEIARWALDLKGILYRDEPHAPGLYVPVINKLTGGIGLWNNPVFVTCDAIRSINKSCQQNLVRTYK